MRATLIDPEGKCDKAARGLHECLIDEGRRLTEIGEYSQALTTLFRAYSLRPGVTLVLNFIADVYDAMAEPDSAIACRRGVIPESAELCYFNAKATAKRIVQAGKASNCRHIKVHRRESIKLQSPKSNGQPTSLPEFRAVKTESRGSFVSILENSSFWFDGFNTVIMDGRQNILNEHVKGNPYVVADAAKHRPESELTGTSCFLDSRSSPIYYHWMMDVLPKFAILHSAGIKLDDIDNFVVRCQSPFQQQTLQHLGVPKERITNPVNDGVMRCQSLIVPFLKNDRGDRFYNGMGLGMAHWLPAWLKSTFVASTPTRSEKIYISRTNRGTRSLTQENELLAKLANRGFRCVTLESMSVVEQATLLASALMVVAPHGAGLTNLAFCQPGTIVVEIFGEYVVPCYWTLSELSALDYHAYFVQSDADKPASAETDQPRINLAERRNRNIELDVDKFIGYIDELAEPQTRVA